MRSLDKIILSAIGIGLFLFGRFHGAVDGIRSVQNEAIGIGLGRHNQSTGKFEWVVSEKTYYGVIPLTPEQKVQNELIMNRLNNWKCE